MLKGRAFKFGDDISTDLIAPGRYAHLKSNEPELAKHVLEDADPTFASRVKPGDFVVAGENFGLGSSREWAPLIIKVAGVSAVLAKSVARIFFRNAINQGLPILICDTDAIGDGDQCLGWNISFCGRIWIDRYHDRFSRSVTRIETALHPRSIREKSILLARIAENGSSDGLG